MGLLLFLKLGVICDSFQTFGNYLFWIDRLNSLDNGLLMDDMMHFSILGESPSRQYYKGQCNFRHRG